MVKKQRTPLSGQIRIIGGLWRGRKLPVLPGSGLRPTSDRTRETLFNWLAPILPGTHCLDCFAGSGALGFEAVSRYAAQSTLLEASLPVATQLQKNITLLGTDKVEVHHTDAIQWLSQPGSPYQVVFLDPPFYQGLLAEAIILLENNGWLADSAWIYVETAALQTKKDMPINWRLQREKVAGQVSYRLYTRYKKMR